MSNIFKKITDLKAELSSMEIKKSGQNKHLGFRYHELGDFLGAISTLNQKYGIAENIAVTNELATLTLTNADAPEENVVVSVPTVFADMQPKNDSIQKLGATLTYLRRYLYIQAYAITEHDVVDALNVKEVNIDNEAQAKKLYAYILKRCDNDKERAKKVSHEFLTTNYNVNSFADIDFSKHSLKDMLVNADAFMGGPFSE